MLVALTGAGGVVGAALVDALTKRGHTVRALCTTESSISSDAEGVLWFFGDIRDEALVRSLLSGVDAVIHLAARKRDEHDSESVNVRGTELVVRIAKSLRVQRFLFLSTISAAFTQPGEYGRTKREAERVIESAQIPAVILRPSVIVSTARDGIVHSLTTKQILGYVPVFGDGSPTFNPLHLTDACAACVTVIETPMTQVSRYDLGGPDAVTLNEFIQRAHTTLRHKKARILHLPTWIGFLATTLLGYILKHPPITRSNVVGMVEHVAVDTEAFSRAYAWRARPLSETLELVRTHDAETEESHLVLSYVLGKPAPQYLYPLYKQSCTLTSVPKISERIFKNTSLLAPLDALTRLFKPQSALQKRLMIAALLCEASPASAPPLLPKPRSIIMVFLDLALLGCKALTVFLFGILLLPTRTYADIT